MQIKQYLYLMRLHKPIGILLLLWPTLWGLWLASDGRPSVSLVAIFVVGVVLMRSAGCVINDIADRHIDKHVERTRDRPLTSGKVSTRSALILFFSLSLLAFLLVLNLNYFTILLAIVGMILAVIYPFLKRITHLPQVGLGLAFAWGVPMAFAAQNNQLVGKDWIVFAAAAVWTLMYDTIYGMVDREDDVKIGVKSTAILFGKQDCFIIGVLQLMCLALLVLTGYLFHRGPFYFCSMIVVAALFYYQQRLIKERIPKKCFKAFLNNNLVGLAVFIGILIS